MRRRSITSWVSGLRTGSSMSVKDGGGPVGFFIEKQKGHVGG